MRSRLLLALAIMTAATAGAASAPLPDIITGTATFNVALAEGGADKSVVRLTGTKTTTVRKVCTRYESEDRLRFTATTESGREVPVSIDRSEAEDDQSYRFAYFAESEKRTINYVAGIATRSPDGVTVELSEPVERTLNLDPAVGFPLKNFRDMIAAAMRGETSFSLVEFSPDGDPARNFITEGRAEIGPVSRDSQTDEERLFADRIGGSNLAHWPVTYFVPAADIKELPLTVYENGFIVGLTGVIAGLHLRFELTDFKPLSPEPCL